MRLRIVSSLALSVLALVALADGVRAETKTWSPSTSGTWSDPTHWSPPGVPAGGDLVQVPASPSAFTLTLDTNTPGLESLDFACTSGTLSLGSFGLSVPGASGASFSGRVLVEGSPWFGGWLRTRASSTLEIPPGGVLTLGGPRWTNDGSATLSVSGATSHAYLRPSGHLTLDGTGTLRLRNADHAIVDSPAGWVLTQSAGHTIAGAGVMSGTFDNHGTLLADAPGQRLLATALRLNDGTLRATNGGLLALSGCAVAGTAGQVIADGGDIELTSTTLVGGSIGRTGSSVVRLAGGNSLADVTHTGGLVIPPGGATTLFGAGLTNSGTIEVGAVGASDYSYLRPASHVMLAGPGDIRLLDPGHSILDSPGGWTVTQAAGHTLHGAGFLSAPITNHGTIAADVAGKSLTVSNSNVNDGTLRATGGGKLILAGGGLNNADGDILASGGDVDLTSTSVSGGTIAADPGSLVHIRSGSGLSNVALGGILRVEPAASLTLGGSGVRNDGRIEIGASGMTDLSYVRPASHVTLSGAGSVVLADEARSVFDSPGGWGITQDAPHAITGTGVLTAPLLNRSVVAADVAGRTLLIAGPVTNAGTLRATNGGRLRLQNLTLGNDQGLVAAEGGDVEMSGVSLQGGQIQRTGSSLVHLRDGEVLSDLVNSAEVRVHGNTAVSLVGEIRNEGTIVMSPPGESQVSWMRPASHVTLSGAGSVVLDRHDLAVLDSPGGWGLTQSGGHSLRGTGWVTAPLMNHGTIRADRDSGALEVAGPNQHDGACEAAFGGRLRFLVPPANLAGTTLTGGTWRAYANSAIQFPGANVITNAAAIVLDGERSRIEQDDAGHSALATLATNEASGLLAIRNGRDFAVGQSFVNRGTILIGDRCEFRLESLGALDSGPSNFTQEATGTLTIEIAERAVDRHGRAEVHGAAHLAGMLRVSVLDGFLATPGDSFEVMTFDERDGGFTTWDGMNVAPGVWLSPVWQAHRLVLVARTQPNVEAPAAEAPASLAFGPRGRAAARELALALPLPARVRVEIFDLAGRRLGTLANTMLPAGRHTWPIPGGSGVRFARALVEDAKGRHVLPAKLALWR